MTDWQVIKCDSWTLQSEYIAVIVELSYGSTCLCVCVCVCVSEWVRVWVSQWVRVCVGFGGCQVNPAVLFALYLLLVPSVWWKRAGHKAGRCIFTSRPSLLEQKLRCRKIMWLRVFHPCHVIRAQGRVWEVLSRSERFFLPSELAVAGSQHAGRETSRVATRTDDWMLERDGQTKRRMEIMSSLSSIFYRPLCLSGFVGSSRACLLGLFLSSRGCLLGCISNQASVEWQVCTSFP